MKCIVVFFIGWYAEKLYMIQMVFEGNANAINFFMEASIFNNQKVECDEEENVAERPIFSIQNNLYILMSLKHVMLFHIKSQVLDPSISFQVF